MFVLSSDAYHIGSYSTVGDAVLGPSRNQHCLSLARLGSAKTQKEVLFSRL